MRSGHAGLRVVLAAATLLLLAPACGDSDPASPTTLLRVLMTDDWVTAPFTDAVREFERTHPNVRVAIDKGPIGRMGDAVRAAIASGAPPDVVQGHAYSAAGQNLAQPVDELWRKYGVTEAEFLPGAVEDVSWGGRLYGIPLDTNAMALLYNVDHFRAAGVQPPTRAMSFDEFANLARALTTPDGSRRALSIPVSGWVGYGWIRANGGEVINVSTDGQPKFTIDHPNVVGALAYLTRLIDEGVAWGPVGTDARSADAYALFRSGTASMHASGSWDLVRIMKEVPGGNFAVALMPQALATTPPGGTAMGGSSMWIPVGSTNAELAMEFMLLLTSDQYALRLAKEEGRLPVRPRLFNDPYFADPQLKVFVEQLGTAHPPRLGAHQDASTAFDQALSQILRDDADPATALRQAQATAVASAGTG